jgi:hypothetical protein
MDLGIKYLASISFLLTSISFQNSKTGKIVDTLLQLYIFTLIPCIDLLISGVYAAKQTL